MKLLTKDLKHRMFKIQIDDAEDLWYLSTIIEVGDTLSGETQRKIKLGGSEEKSKISLRNCFLSITAEKISYDAQELRVSGPIIDGPDDIPRGDYHTFALSPHTVITLVKTALSIYIAKKIEEACVAKTSAILIVAFDREEAIFAQLKSNGYDILLDLKGDVSRKDDASEKKSNFYSEIVNQIIAYDARYHFTTIIIASPAFWKEYLLKEVKDENLRKRITLATCSSVDEAAMTEILQRSELQTVLQKERSSREEVAVGKLLEAIQKDLAAYSYVAVQEKLEAGNVAEFLISENLIRSSRLDGSYPEIEKLLYQVEALDATLYIISSPDAAKKLDGLSGIAVVQRWKEQY